MRSKLIVLVLFAIFLSFSVTQAQTFPNASFRTITLSSTLTQATAFAFGPDGRVFVAQQTGELLLFQYGLFVRQLIDFTVDSAGERGLIGVAVDPNYTVNQYIYVHYTMNTTPRRARITRLTMNGNALANTNETEIFLLDTLSGNTNHNGGAMHFGTDGKLYIAVGDNNISSNAQTLQNLHGKMLRINPDGTIPTDNPFYNSTTGNNRAIWAYGLRNPFTFAVQPGTGLLYINDVGAGSWEEVNPGVAGANYGWPNTEGPTSNPAFTEPVYAYPHPQGCAITGGAFYNPSRAQFGASYVGDYFLADYCGQWLRVYDVGTDTATDFAADLPDRPVDLRVSDDGSLYYLTRTGLYRLIYDANFGTGNRLWNGSFEIPAFNAIYPLFWQISSDGNSRSICTGNAPRSGDCGLRIAGGTPFSMQQVARPTAGAGESLSFTGYVRAGTVVDGSVRVRMIVIYDDGSRAPINAVSLSSGNGSDYVQFASAPTPLTRAVARVRLQVASTGVSQTLTLDDLALQVNSSLLIPMP